MPRTFLTQFRHIVIVEHRCGLRCGLMDFIQDGRTCLVIEPQASSKLIWWHTIPYGIRTFRETEPTPRVRTYVIPMRSLVV